MPDTGVIILSSLVGLSTASLVFSIIAHVAGGAFKNVGMSGRLKKYIKNILRPTVPTPQYISVVTIMKDNADMAREQYEMQGGESGETFWGTYQVFSIKPDPVGNPELRKYRAYCKFQPNYFVEIYYKNSAERDWFRENLADPNNVEFVEFYTRRFKDISYLED